MNRDGNENLLGKIGPVDIGIGFVHKKGRKRVRSYKYPHDRMTAFLKVDATDSEKVRVFCRDYLLIPRKLEKGWLQGFQEEQKKLRGVMDAYEKDELIAEDLNLINEELKSSHNVIRGNKILKSGNIKREYLYSVTNQGSSLVSLWEDLMSYMLGNSLLTKCPGCGIIFTRNKSRNQRFCDEHCRQAFHKRKNYRRSREKAQ